MKQDLPLVSIVIPAYNLSRYLAEAIQSVLNQNYHNIELIVLDDGSKDQTRQVLEKYTGRFYWETHQNMGQVNTLNKGWQMSKAKILAWIGADDALLPNAVSRSVDHILANPDVVLTYCDFNLIDLNSAFIRRVKTADFNYHNMVVKVIYPPGPGTFFRRSAYETVKLWDSSLKIMLDYDYWLRLGLVGRFLRIPKVLALYRIPPDQETFSRMDEFKAAEPVRVVSHLFGSGTLPQSLVKFRDKALSNAHLVSSQLHFRGGRYRLGLAALRIAFALCPNNFFTLLTLRRAFNVLFNR